MMKTEDTRNTEKAITMKTKNKTSLHIGRTGPGMRHVVQFGDQSTGRGSFGANLGSGVGTLRRPCVTVPQPSELRFGMVRLVGRGIAALDGVHVLQWEGEVLGVLFPIFTMENAIGSPTVKCFRFVCENFTTFPFGKRILESSIRGLFGDVFSFNIKVVAYKKLAKT